MSRRDRDDPGPPQSEADESALIRASVKALDASVEQLPPGIDSRLRAARREALEGAHAGGLAAWSRRAGLSAVASLLIVVGAVVLLRPVLESGPAPLPSIYQDEVQQLAAQELELLEQLEFLAWLELEAENEDAS